MHLVGFVIRVYHDARSPECQDTKSIATAVILYVTRTLQHLQLKNSIGARFIIPLSGIITRVQILF